MPHSSGGGSHSSGSHSSYHSSSSSSSSYSSSSYSGWQPGEYRCSTRYFPGASRYVYYDRSGRYHNIYRSGSGRGLDAEEFWTDFIVFTLIAAMFIGILLACGVYKPRKIDLSSYNHSIVISDSVGLIEDSQIEAALENFQKTTGITPAIEVVYDSQWNSYYNSLERFAYSEYLRMFTDEKHWLVVISYPDNYQELSFIDWSWEGMIGDDCSKTVNSKSEKDFTTLFHHEMLNNTPDTLEKAINDTYNELSKTIMTTQKDAFLVNIAKVLIAIYAAIMYWLTSVYYKDSKYEQSVYVSNNAQEKTCINCGNVYISGTVRVCPKCGVPVAVNTKSNR